MKAIVRRLTKLENSHQHRRVWSWTEEYEAIQEATLRKMSTPDLMLLEPTLADLDQRRRGDLSEAQQTVLNRWEAMFDRTAKETGHLWTARDRWL